MRKKEEIYSEEEMLQIKSEFTLIKVFKLYRKYREVLLDEVVDKMLANSGDTQPKANNGPIDKLSTYADEKIDAERFVSFIDGLMNQLDDRAYDIIDLKYREPYGNDGECIPDKEIYEDILDISERQYYRDKKKAKLKMYRLLVKNMRF